MFYLGIDIGKNTHVAFLIDEKAKPLFKAFSFSNTTEGANSLIEKLSVHINNQSEIEIGMEATGHYWLSIYSFLAERGFIVHVLNPIQTDGWRKGTEIRKRKTDIIDSVLIADLIRYGDFVETSLSDEDTMSLRNLSRFRSYLVSSIGDLKRKVICVLDQVFPEYQTVFQMFLEKLLKKFFLTFRLLTILKTSHLSSLKTYFQRFLLRVLPKIKSLTFQSLLLILSDLNFVRTALLYS